VLRATRSICAESAAGEGLSRNQRAASGDGARAERGVVALPAPLNHHRRAG
jgi:hypothetical protein